MATETKSDVKKLEVKKESSIKVKKKNWFKILSPKIFGERAVGETYLLSLESAFGSVLKINLRDLTGNIRDQHVYIGLKIIKSQSSQLQTSLVSYNITPSYIKRQVRKGIDRMDDYFLFTTKDGQQVIAKTFMLTQNKAHRSVRGMLRSKLREQLETEIKTVDFETLISSLVTTKVQGSIRKMLNKIYPLKELAVRVLELQGAEQLLPAQEIEVPSPRIEVAQ